MREKTKKELVRKYAKKEAAAASKLSDAIGDFAELGFEEVRSSEATAEYLASHGFKVEFPWPHMPTAFKATAGKGRPSIGMLAEYDALPNCGLKQGSSGHGCSHNLLGVGSAAAAVLAVAALKEKGMPGRITLWGCPAEELLAGKVFMARDGAFRGHDAILGWHPGGATAVKSAGGSAMDCLLFEYHGRTAHGAYAHAGRSALDGVVLLDVAVNYLREHVPDNVRIHMAVREGGDAPNVVPAYASSWYYVRARTRVQVDEIRERVIKCAKGAAMSTDTRVKVTRLTGVYDRLPNIGMSELVLKNLQLFGPVKVTAADKRNAEKKGGKPFFSTRISDVITETRGFASSDESNVSWLAPMGVFNVTCFSKGVGGHHRSQTAQVKLPFAHKGMLRAAEVMAGCALDLCANPKLLKRAQAEFKKRTKGFKYDPLVPKKQKLPTEILKKG